MKAAAIGNLSSSSSTIKSSEIFLSRLYRGNPSSPNFHSNPAFPFLNFNNYTNKPSKNFAKSIHTFVYASLSSDSFRPEEARVPPALPLPPPTFTKFKIALCQLLVTTDKERNVVNAREAIKVAAERGAQLVLLPEIWNSPYSNNSFPVQAEDIDAGRDASPSTAMLSEVSQSLGITIVGGSIPERCGNRLYNTCCVFGPDGKLKAKHRKIHLFDIDIPGQITFKESNTITAGYNPTIVDTVWRSGCNNRA